MGQILMPARPDRAKMHPVCARLVGRDPDVLTEIEEKLAEHFGLYGDLYWCNVTRTQDHILLETDLGHPGTPASIMVPPDTPLAEAAWELAEVISYYMDEYPHS